MRRAALWIVTGLGIAVASIAVFLVAAWLFPGAPERLYLILGGGLLSITLLALLALSRRGAGVEHVYEIRNDVADELEVWIEPWCHPYRIPRGAVLKLVYAAAEGAPLYTEALPERLVVYTNSAYAPDAELNGQPVAPDFG